IPPIIVVLQYREIIVAGEENMFFAEVRCRQAIQDQRHPIEKKTIIKPQIVMLRTIASIMV
ncbi:hypothetical protein, partial [Acinetobacter baumannii]|uniref:hypothetical protein n=1 Tax=Acinetobacter baumannii TaxID=470 RepID=UPI0028A1EECE